MDQNDIGRWDITYFTEAYVGLAMNVDVIKRDTLTQNVPSVLKKEDNNLIISQVMEEEVRRAFFSMKAYKAPRPNEFHLALFQHFWEMVKKDITMDARDFFKMGKLLRRLNNNFIVLVPKVQDPKSLTDFKPISLSNTIYKVFSKILVNIIKPFLEILIGPPQKGFFLGRHIMDVLVSTHEVIHSMDKRRVLGMTLKLGISKNYDKVY